MRRSLIPAAVFAAYFAAVPTVVHADNLLTMGVGAPGAGGGGGYTGPVDVVSSATFWWGLRAASSAARGTRAVRLCQPAATNCVDVNSDATTGVVPNAPTVNAAACDNSGHVCTVSTLYDQMVNGADFVQATGANQPIWKVSAIGSRPCIQYDGTNGFLLTGTVTSLSQPYTYSAVADRTTATGLQAVIIESVGATYFYFPTTANTAAIYAGVTITQAASDAAFHAIQGVYQASSLAVVNVDNSAGTAGDAGSQASGTQLGMGSDSGGGQKLTGFICEGGLWPVAFSGTQQTNMSSNQHTYWGF